MRIGVLLADNLKPEHAAIDGDYADPVIALMSEQEGIEDLGGTTLLLMAGVPPAGDIDGDAWLPAFTDDWQRFAARLAEDQVDTYETIVPPRDPSAEVDPAIEAEALERLKALGYIE